MTTGALRAGTGTAPREDSAEAAVRAFFAAYRAHDVEGMVIGQGRELRLRGFQSRATVPIVNSEPANAGLSRVGTS